MSEHTPTPWRYQEEADAYTHILRAGKNRYLASFSQTSAPHSEANARRAVACVNAFHSPDGRTITTENIAEGAFWNVYRFMEWAAWQPCTCPDADPCMSCQACDVINSLKIQEPET